jgi:dTDP-4-amino-4,6-dideoxygalactose transaminase
MIKLFNIESHHIDTSKYSNLLHDRIVRDLECKIADYVNAKYSVSLNSASSCLFLCMLNKDVVVNIPSMIPPVVVNAIINSGNKYKFKDNVKWVGDSYIFHDFGEYKIVDSAQKITKDQFKNECSSDDLMIFSFYPTKPIGGIDGGMIVSNDKNKIEHIREMTLNGMVQCVKDRSKIIKFPGYKMYMNSVQAQIILNNFNKYHTKLEKIEKVRETYNEAFGLKNSSYHLYRINVENRDNLIKYLNDQNIICGVHYEALHKHTVYKLSNEVLPNTDKVEKTTISIPFHEKLNASQINLVIEKINDFKRI